MAVVFTVARGEHRGISASFEGHYTVVEDPLLLQVLATDAVWNELSTFLEGSMIASIVLGDDDKGKSRIYVRDGEGREPVDKYDFPIPYPSSSIVRLVTSTDVVGITRVEHRDKKSGPVKWKW